MDSVTQPELDALVLSAQQGKRNALELLYEYYQPAMLRFAYTLCSDQQLAMDAVHDVWLKSVNSLSRLNDPRAFKAWIFRAVKWRIIDIHRKRKSFENAVERMKPTEDEELGVNNEENIRLTNLIRHLPENEKEAIYLFYQAQFSLADIAALQGVPSGTVKSRLNRARNRLKKQLEGHNEY